MKLSYLTNYIFSQKFTNFVNYNSKEKVLIDLKKKTECLNSFNKKILDNIIEKNKDSIYSNYAQKTYAERLEKIYQSILNSPRDGLEYAQGEELLDCFLSPARFNLLRT